MTIDLIFNIPLVHYKCSQWETKKQRLLSHLDSRTLTQGDEPVLNDYSDNAPVDVITDIMSDELSLFAHDLNCTPVIARAWYERAHPGMYHVTHNHGHGGWSSVVYIEYNPEQHQPTQILSPFNNFITGEAMTYSPYVTEGDMIIFPSFLHHYTHPHTSEQQRTILSFNVRINPPVDS